ncbi:pyruvate formate lyase activating enzyme [Lipomyces doorenjongii]
MPPRQLSWSHNCAVERYQSTGYCALGAGKVTVSTISPHFGKESCMTGTNGSGSIFFASWNLRCVFCQNYEISHITRWMVNLQDMGQYHNINFVTPEHVVPIVSPDSAKRLLKSEHHPKAARRALTEMTTKQGVLIRHLIMPNHLDEYRQILRYIADEVDKDSYVNIMSQCFPSDHVGRKSTRGSGTRYEELYRHVTDEEFEDIMTVARRVGLWRFNRAEEYAGHALAVVISN